MLKRILSLSVLLLLCCNLVAEESAPKYFQFIDMECNEKEVYKFDLDTFAQEDSPRRMGHLIRLSFPTIKKDFVADLSLSNPENPESKDSAVGVITRVRWDGGANDEFGISARISFQNKAILEEAFSTIDGSPEIELEFVIYDYDYNAKSYFKRFYSLKNPIKFTVAEGSRVYIGQFPNTWGARNPINFSIELPLVPKAGAKEQKVGFSFSSTSPKYNRPMGVMQK